MVNHELRFLPTVQALKDVLRSGDIGTLKLK
jgi:predicted dehydrogenase